MSIAENIYSVSRQIAFLEQKYDRVHGSAQLLAVSKTQVTEKIMQARHRGQLHFAENYLQEALPKIFELNTAGLTWHFIGPIQGNKTKSIAENFSWVHSLDRIKIAHRLNTQRPAELPPLKVLIQVNIDNEENKSGCSVDQVDELATQISLLPRLILAGLMTIPSPKIKLEEQRQAFSRLAMVQKSLQTRGFHTCQQLSMGMSQDFEAAIAEGATMVRIGTGIFGKRE